MNNQETLSAERGADSGAAHGSAYCAVCGEWPAMETALGLRCHLCECRDYAAAHPVPLPENPAMLRDLASIGVPGAARRKTQSGGSLEPVGSEKPRQQVQCWRCNTDLALIDGEACPTCGKTDQLHEDLESE